MTRNQRSERYRERCKEWLREKLEPGIMVDVDTIRHYAKHVGFSRYALKAARQELGVKTRSVCDPETKQTKWFWYREEEDQDAGS